MKKLLLTIVTFTIITVSTNAQNISFQKYFGSGDFSLLTAIAQTSDGGYILSGSKDDVWTLSHPYAWILKTDSNGEIIWSKIYDGGGFNNLEFIKQTIDGGYISGGWNEFTGTTKGFLLKLDATGDTTWAHNYGIDGEEFFDITTVNGGGYAVVGNANYYSSGAADDMLVMKTDISGNILWLKAIGKTNEVDNGNSIEQTSDNGFIVCGNTSFGAGNLDAYLVKFNSTGDTIWTKTYGGVDFDYGNDVIQTTDGGYLLCGSTLSYGSGNADILLIKTNALGSITWARAFGSTQNDEASSVIETSGGYIVSGYQANLSNSDDFLILKVNTSGDLIWTKSIGSIEDEQILQISTTSDGGFAATGFLNNSNTGDLTTYFLKAGNDGSMGGCNEITPNVIQTNITVSTGSGGVISTGNDISALGITTANYSAFDSLLCFTNGINSNESNTPVSFYPNPTTGIITLDLGDAQNFNEIKIYNSIGALVGSENVKSVSGKVNIDLNKYGKGLFFLTSSNAENTFSGKVIVE